MKNNLNEQPPLKCKCGSKEFNRNWNAADVINEWGEVIDDLECDADEQIECRKCGHTVIWRD